MDFSKKVFSICHECSEIAFDDQKIIGLYYVKKENDFHDSIYVKNKNKIHILNKIKNSLKEKGEPLFKKIRRNVYTEFLNQEFDKNYNDINNFPSKIQKYSENITSFDKCKKYGSSEKNFTRDKKSSNGYNSIRINSSNSFIEDSCSDELFNCNFYSIHSSIESEKFESESTEYGNIKQENINF